MKNNINVWTSEDEEHTFSSVFTQIFIHLAVWALRAFCSMVVWNNMVAANSSLHPINFLIALAVVLVILMIAPKSHSEND